MASEASKGNRVAAIAKTLRSNRAGCIMKAVRAGRRAQTLLLLVVSLVWHVVSGGATPSFRGDIHQHFDGYLSRISSGSPGDHGEKGFYDGSSRSGCSDQANGTEKGGCRPEKTSNDVEV